MTRRERSLRRVALSPRPPMTSPGPTVGRIGTVERVEREKSPEARCCGRAFLVTPP